MPSRKASRRTSPPRLEPARARPFEAVERPRLPEGDEWQFEPKWDGFRCLAFRREDAVDLRSKAGKPLARYFPEVVGAVRGVRAGTFVLDGEIVIPVGRGTSFDDLLLRIHPSKSRVDLLAASRPALYVVFDILEDETGSLVDLPLVQRRERLERFAQRAFARVDGIALSPVASSRAEALRWLRGGRTSFDGVVAKRVSEPYRMGERSAVKVKRRRTIDCVVGGFRRSEGSDRLGSILLGLYGKDGLLHHVGAAASLERSAKETLEPLLLRSRQAPGFTGRAPGGPSRWTGEARPWEPVAPRVVVEVEIDHASGDRIRHGARFLRLRPDKAPRTCTIDQLRAAWPAPNRKSAQG
jgi:ATP-dependent DNA ligase